MSGALLLLLLALCIFASALYSGVETGFYTLSRQRVDIDLERGHRAARIMRWLLQHDAALLVTLLVGNNLTHELISYLASALFLKA